MVGWWGGGVVGWWWIQDLRFRGEILDASPSRMCGSCEALVKPRTSKTHSVEKRKSGMFGARSWNMAK